jgi:hypothetical protein
MAKYATLNEAMVANDELGEVELRYELLSATFEDMPQMQSQLNTQLERAKAEIFRLRALAPKGEATSSDSGKVVAIDANRFRKSS